MGDVPGRRSRSTRSATSMGSASCSPMRRRSWPSTSITALTNAGRSPRGPRPSSQQVVRLCGAQSVRKRVRRYLITRLLAPTGRKKGDIECYDTLRYVTVTGLRLGGMPATINSRLDEMLTWHAEVSAAPHDERHVTPVPTVGATHSRTLAVRVSLIKVASRQESPGLRTVRRRSDSSREDVRRHQRRPHSCVVGWPLGGFLAQARAKPISPSARAWPSGVRRTRHGSITSSD